MHRNLLSLSLVIFSLSTGCATEPEADVIADGAIVEDTLSDTTAVDGNDNEQPAPYAGMDFQVRIELGAASVDQPEAGLYVDRILANIDGTWQGLTRPDEAVDVRWSNSGRWAPIYEGDMNAGMLESLDLMLGEEASMVQNGDAWDAWVQTDDRSFSVEPAVQTLGDEPVVITILLAVEQDGDELQVSVSEVLVRQVDEDGNAWALLDPRD